METKQVSNQLLTNEELIEKFRVATISGSKSNTAQAYISDVKEFASYINKNLLQSDSDDIFGFFAKINAKPRTHNRKRASLTQFFRFLIENRNIEFNYNPVLVKGKHVPTKHAEIFTDDEILKLLECIKDLIENGKTEFVKKIAIRDLAIISLLVSTGLRIGELTSGTFEQLNLGRRTFKVLGEEAKGKEDRVQPFSDEVKLTIKNYIDNVRPKCDSQYIFASHNGKKLSTSDVTHAIKKYGETAKIKDCKLHPHAFRHYFGTRLYRQTGDIKIAQEYLGHADISTTSRIYVTVDKSKSNSKVVDTSII